MPEIITGVLLFAFGVGAVWLVKRLQIDLGEASKTAIVLLPLLLYLVLSNKLTEFEGYGLKAKFRSLGAQSVITAARTSDLATLSEQKDPADFFNEAQWGFCRPYYLLTDGVAKVKGKANELDQRVTLSIATAIRTSIICGKFMALVIVDDDRRPLGFFPRDQFLELLRIGLVEYGGPFVDSDTAFARVKSSELGVILLNPIVRAKSDEAKHDTVSNNDDIVSVYRKMVAANVGIALLTDRLGRFDGVITRAVIEGKIIDALLSATK